MTGSRQANRSNNVWHWRAIGQCLPFGRQGQLFIIQDGLEIGLFDDVLRADLASREPALTDPTPDCLWIPTQAASSFRNSQHACRILQHCSPPLGAR